MMSRMTGGLMMLALAGGVLAAGAVQANDFYGYDGPFNAGYDDGDAVDNGNGYCREFTQQIVVGGRWVQGYGTSCQQQDGSWRIVRDAQVTVAPPPPPPVRVVQRTVVVREPVYVAQPAPYYDYGYGGGYGYAAPVSLGFSYSSGGWGRHGGWGHGGRHW